MAKNNLANYTEADGLGFPLNFRRGNPNPLDNSSVWSTLEAAQNYAKNDPVAYVGQIISVVNSEKNEVTVYSIQDTNGTLKPVGTVPVGDGKSIVVDADKIKILGVDEAETGAQLVKQADGSVAWVVPSTDTVEGLQSSIAGLNTRTTALESAVGNSEKGLVKNVADLTTEVGDIKSDLTDNYYDKSEVDGLISGAFHFKGTADHLGTDGNLYADSDEANVITGKTGDVYQIGDKEYAYNGSAWIELGFTLDLTGYATTASVTKSIGDAKTELRGEIDIAKKGAVTEANSYTDTAIETLGIADYAKKTEVADDIKNAKAETAVDIAKAKEEAVTTAGTNADAKITAKIGEIGESTVKAYVDNKETSIKAQISAVESKVDGLGAMAKKDTVTETDLAEPLQTKINGKADKGTTLAEYGITDAYTSVQVDSKVKAVDDKVVINTQAIADINNAETGVLAQAKAYADTKVYDDSAIKANVNKNTQDIAAINNETTGILAEAKKYTDGKVYDDAMVKADIKANTDAIAVLNGDKSTEGSVRKIAADEVASIVAGAPDKLDTFKEVADWIETDETNSTQMIKDIATIKGDDADKSMRDIAEEVVGDIPLATQAVAGLIKGTDGKITVNNGEITAVSLDVIEQGDTVLILDGGASEI